VEDSANDANNKRVKFNETEAEQDQSDKSSDKCNKGNKSEKGKKDAKPVELDIQEPADPGETPKEATPHPDWDVNLLDPVEQRLGVQCLKQVSEQQHAMDLLLNPEPIMDAGITCNVTRHNKCKGKDGTERLEFQCESAEGKKFKCEASDL
jgi:hypothetical protein